MEQQLTEKDIKKLTKWAENIYNTTIVVEHFCRTKQEIEELYNLLSIIENLRDETDKNCSFWTQFNAENNSTDDNA